MKVVVIGMSPYNTSSVSRLHRLILKKLFFSNFDVLSLSWAHDFSYYVQEEDGFYYYRFVDKKSAKSIEYKIPIVPLKRGISDPVPVYEAINHLEPDVVITIGDLAESAVMKAIKTLASKKFKWLAVLTQSSFPIQEEIFELAEYMDGVLCSSDCGRNEIAKIFHGLNLKSRFVGCDLPFISSNRNTDNSKFRVMTLGKISQADNVPMVMEACAEAKKSIPNLELYVHANIYDKGDYQIDNLKKRFDPEGNFIVLPDKFVSLVDGISDESLAEEYLKSHVFISAPLAAGTGMSIFEAMGCGCFPILSDCPVNSEIAKNIGKEIGDENFEKSVLIPTTKLMSTGESYLFVPNIEKMVEMIVSVYKIREKLEGCKSRFDVFLNKNKIDSFVQEVVDMTTILEKSNDVPSLEDVRRRD